MLNVRNASVVALCAALLIFPVAQPVDAHNPTRLAEVTTTIWVNPLSSASTDLYNYVGPDHRTWIVRHGASLSYLTSGADRLGFVEISVWNDNGSERGLYGRWGSEIGPSAYPAVSVEANKATTTAHVNTRLSVSAFAHNRNSSGLTIFYLQARAQYIDAI